MPYRAKAFKENAEESFSRFAQFVGFYLKLDSQSTGFLDNSARKPAVCMSQWEPYDSYTISFDSQMDCNLSSKWARYLPVAVCAACSLLIITVINSKRPSKLPSRVSLSSEATGTVVDPKCFDGVPVASMKADVPVTTHQYGHRRKIHRNRTSCLDKTFAGNETSLLPLTALASYPGSGNTWTRHLIELSTGFYTGSIYKDKVLKVSFPGEGEQSGSVITVKTHWPWVTKKLDRVEYERVVLIIRTPLDAMKAEFKRTSKRSHVGQVQSINETVWEEFVERETPKYQRFHDFWFDISEKKSLDLFVLFYDDLRENSAQALINLAHFLGISDIRDQLPCIQANMEGSFHRKAPGTAEVADPFGALDETLSKGIDKIAQIVNGQVQSCMKKGDCVTSGSTQLRSH
ncbi:hypothetical protein CAPTEDRAFT_193836 [Capitella teleta]|uniref:Sulfotransferase domain-containing protein n=1 Tax=Capitella teleta TaxID=283909 RepID=R7UYM8_CAPTE|nr:hypothetical protein CAPTEDRAFT_193836 [Capitella teleta]|eukprot:ELU11434.1 hypothetical protein CAPTEDRAFT_193836 [Capitella teleta]